MEPTSVHGPKKNGRPAGRSTKWDSVPRRSVSPRPRSRSPPPPPLLGSAVPATRPAVIVARTRSVSPTPSIGQADRSRNASLAASRKKRPGATQPRRPTPSPTPGDHRVGTHAIVRPQPKRSRPSTLSRCLGLYDGFFGTALYFVGRSMLHTGRRLIEWAKECDAGVASFRRSALANSSELLLPFRGMTVRKAAEGFSLHRTDCEGSIASHRCSACSEGRRQSVKYVTKLFQPQNSSFGIKTRIETR